MIREEEKRVSNGGQCRRSMMVVFDGVDRTTATTEVVALTLEVASGPWRDEGGKQSYVGGNALYCGRSRVHA